MTAREGWTASHESPIRVLMIEDSFADALRTSRRLQAELGSLEALELERRPTLQEGIERLAKRNVDVVLLDLNLPDSAGIDTVRRLRCAAPEVPLVVLTGSSEGDVPVRALQAGAQDYLGKSDFETGPLVNRSLRYAIERVRIETEGRRLQHELDEATRMQSLGVLGAGAAFGFAQLIGQILEQTDEALAALPGEPRFDAARERLERVRGAALHGAELAAQLREYARSGPRPLEPLSPSELVRAAQPQLEAIAGSDVSLELLLADDAPRVRADGRELHQLLLNLVLNASEAIRPGRGWIRIETDGATVDAARLARCHAGAPLAPGRYASLSVTDSGIGLDAERLPHVFDPFFTTKFAGRGLGLAAALAIARRHGGGIAAGNAPDGGARFEVLIPEHGE